MEPLYVQICTVSIDRGGRGARRAVGPARRAVTGRVFLIPKGPPPPSAGEPPVGAARRVRAGGGTYLSIVGANRLFHHPRDRWPDAVDVDRIARCARAFADLGCNWRTAEGNGPARALPAHRAGPPARRCWSAAGCADRAGSGVG